MSEAFWDRVQRSPDCWLWTGGKDRHGYGRLRWNGRNESAHRIAYTLERGPIPAGTELDHLCRVRACVNPGHLEPVTHRENVLRGEGVGARNAATTHCPAGHPYDDHNTYRLLGKRYCRPCKRDAKRALRAAV